MNINPNAPLVDQHSIVIQAPRAVVWHILTNVERWPEWHPAITQAQLDGPLAPDSSFRWTSGGMAILSTIHDLEPEQRISWSGKALGTAAEHVWTLEDTPDGTRVSTAESMGGWLIYPVKLISPRFLTDALHTWLAALKQAAEAQPAEAQPAQANLSAGVYQ
jgi:uncharacterized protein YndB with AHSA1/START domain